MDGNSKGWEKSVRGWIGGKKVVGIKGKRMGCGIFRLRMRLDIMMTGMNRMNGIKGMSCVGVGVI